MYLVVLITLELVPNPPKLAIPQHKSDPLNSMNIVSVKSCNKDIPPEPKGFPKIVKVDYDSDDYRGREIG